MIRCNYLFHKSIYFSSIAVHRPDLQKKALELFKDLDLPGTFQASVGWVDKFLKRNALASRRVTGHSQKIPENAGVMCSVFITQCHDTISKKSKPDHTKI